MDTIFTTFYTENSPYEKAADNLKKSFDKFGLEYDIQCYPDRGSWQKNTHIKIDHLLNMFVKHIDKAIVWVDADGEIVKLPNLLLFYIKTYPFTTFAAHILHHPKRYKHLPGGSNNELLGGTMWFAPNNSRIEFLDEVKLRIVTYPDRYYGEQLFIQEVNEDWLFERYRNKNNIVWGFEELPEKYCAIYDRAIGKNAVIIHYQASRDLRLYAGDKDNNHVINWERRLSKIKGY